MKQIISILACIIVMLVSSSQLYAKVQYRGFVDVTGGYHNCYALDLDGIGGYGASTSHGIQFSRNSFVGISIGGLFGQQCYDHNDTATYSLLIPSLTYRFDFSTNSRHSAYIACKAGYASFSMDYEDTYYDEIFHVIDNEWRYLIELSGGYRFAFNDYFGLNVGPSIFVGGFERFFYVGLSFGVDF